MLLCAENIVSLAGDPSMDCQQKVLMQESLPILLFLFFSWSIDDNWQVLALYGDVVLFDCKCYSIMGSLESHPILLELKRE